MSLHINIFVCTSGPCPLWCKAILESCGQTWGTMFGCMHAHSWMCTSRVRREKVISFLQRVERNDVVSLGRKRMYFLIVDQGILRITYCLREDLTSMLLWPLHDFALFLLLSCTFFADVFSWLCYYLSRHTRGIMVSNVGLEQCAHSTTCLLPNLHIKSHRSIFTYVVCLLSCKLLRGRDYVLLLFVAPVQGKLLGTHWVLHKYFLGPTIYW